MAKRKRDVPVLFWVSAEELELIHQKMQQYGTENLSAYLRKMALDGYVVKLELPELKELVSLMRRSSNNLNQLTRKVHQLYPAVRCDICFNVFLPFSCARKEIQERDRGRNGGCESEKVRFYLL